SRPRYLCSFSLSPRVPLRHLPSFPTRRSSDLLDSGPGSPTDALACRATFETAANDRGLAALDAFPVARGCRRARPVHGQPLQARDRKSTRLNSSHQIISYAVFCLKKKTHLTTS